MDLVLEEFKKDLGRLKKLLKFLETTKQFASSDASFPEGDIAKEMHVAAGDCHTDLLVISGAIVLYLCGRFEFFVRERFEELCDKIAGNCQKFVHLPKAMRECLVELTAEVMLDPRKYGHAEKGVESFVKSLSENMSATSGLTSINRQCLSITSENMRADTVKALFERVGLKDIWKTVGEQAAVRAHFASSGADAAKSKTTEFLNNVMDTRNRIAHPSANVEWPDISKVKEYIIFFDVLSPVICDVLVLHEAVLKESRTAESETDNSALSETGGIK